MNAPLIWILIPLGVSVLLYVAKRYKLAVTFVGLAFALALAAMAYYGSMSGEWDLGPVPVELGDTLSIFGRRFSIPASQAPVLILVYLGVAFWFGGVTIAKVEQHFVPAGLAMSALLVAAFSVEPFLYAALIIELAVLLGVMMLASPGKPVAAGIMRFLIFQTLGMPFILFVGWLLAGVEASPGSPMLTIQAGTLLGLGFAFLLGVFPFHTWMPMLLEEAHPYVVAFVIHILIMIISLFGLSFFEQYAWLRTLADLYLVLQTAGGVMIVAGGWYIAFERHLGRMLGYYAMFQIGVVLLAISPGIDFEGHLPLLPVVFASILSRGLSFAVWALALVKLAESVPEQSAHEIIYRFRNMQGVGRDKPIAAGSLLLAHFSLAGLPLLAGFSVLWALWHGLARDFPWLAFAAMAGSAGAFFGGMRSLAVLVMGQEEKGWRITEGWSSSVLLLIGSFGMLAIGLFPQWFFPAFERMAEIFQQLSP